MKTYVESITAAKMVLMLLALISPTVSQAAQEYLCFEGISDKQNILCYPNTTNSDREPVVEQAVDHLGFKLDKGEPVGSLAIMAPDMARFYTQDKFEASLQKHFPLLDRDSIEHIVHHNEYSAVLLTDASQLLFDHEKLSFVFSFEEPPPLAGLAYYYGRRSKPGKWSSALPTSNCSLSRDGITFVAPAADHLTYDQTGSFCTYDGYYFNSKVEVRRLDQIGQGQSLVSASGLPPFLEWLRESE